MGKIAVTVWLWTLLAGCSSEGSAPLCMPACTPPMVCDPNTHSCVPAGGCHLPHENCGGRCVDLKVDPGHCGACGNSCGPNAQCSDHQCVCFPSFHNCNATFADGCECSTNCDAQQRCVVHGVTCDPAVAGDCSVDNFCDRALNQCVACPSGWTNCDRIDACECSGTCVGSECLDQRTCDPNRAGDCGDASHYCYPVTMVCKRCPEGQANCDLTGQCECPGFCLLDVFSCAVCDPQQIGVCDAYGAPHTTYCSNVDKVCKACPAGINNCDRDDSCECFGPCAGTPPTCAP